MQDVAALIEKLAAGFNEILRRPLKPGGGHPAVLVPDGGKAFPVARIAVQHPIFHHLADGEFISDQITHVAFPFSGMLCIVCAIPSPISLMSTERDKYPFSKRLPKISFSTCHHAPGGLLLHLERTAFADQQADVDKRIVRVAVSDAIVRETNRATLDALQVDRAGGRQFSVQTCQQRLNIKVQVIGVFESQLRHGLLHRRRAVRVEGRDGRQAPGLALLPIRLAPDNRLPVGCQHQTRAGAGDLKAIPARFIYIQEKRLLDGMLVRTGLHEDAVLQANICSAQDVLADGRKWIQFRCSLSWKCPMWIRIWTASLTRRTIVQQLHGLAVFMGCPDTDGDGVEDSRDDCPVIAGLLEFNGCPDTDGDGIKDGIDSCPTVPGVAAFSGCPDTDMDGIEDAMDKCPTVAGISAFQGCPDTDMDGTEDSKDKCPKTYGPSPMEDVR